MNKRIDFSNLGGYPLAQEDLDYLQQSYRGAFAALTGVIGDKVIISGMVQNGDQISSGWISLNGELLPFTGGTLVGDGTFMVDTTKQSLTFQDGVAKDVLIEKFARFSDPGQFKFTDLRRVTALKETWLKYDIKEVDCDAEYIAQNFDATGLGINERTGWQICNGQRGTQDRGGRVSVGFTTRTIDPGDGVWDQLYNAIRSTGGLKQAAISLQQLPKHRFFLFSDDNQSGDQSTAVNGSNYAVRDLENAGALSYRIKGKTVKQPTTGLSSEVGGDQPFSKMQPFIVSLHIMKL